MSARRVYWRSLAALIVVAPLALWTACGEDYLAYRLHQAVQETVVAAGTSAEFAGSRWQIDRIETFDGALPATPGSVVATPRLPAGARLLRVRIALRAGSVEAVQKLDRCQLELVDRRRRRWTAASSSTTARRDVATRCNGSHGDAPQIAQEFRFEQDFLLPADAAGEADALIRLGAEEPRLLRLQLR